MEPARSGAFQSGGKPPRSRPALRLHGDLHHPPVRPGEGTARPPRPSTARIRRRGEPGQVAILAPAGATRRGTLHLAEADDRCRRYLSSAALGPTEASRFLPSVPELESAGVVVRMPVSWHASRPARPQVTATIGSRAPSTLGLDGLLDFQMGVMLEGEPLSEAEVASLLADSENLVLLRGQWVEVDRARLQRTMEQFHAAEELAARNGLTFAEAMRMLAGAA